MKTTGRSQSAQAAAAKSIRRDLKAAFPTVTFSVRSCSFAGGNAVDISWMDGPSRVQVDTLVGKYQEGDFNGMEDYYEYSNRRNDVPQVKYVQCHREYSRKAMDEAIVYLNTTRGFNLRPGNSRFSPADPASDKYIGNGWASQEVYPALHAQPLVCGGCHAETVVGDRFCADCGTALVATDR